MRDAVGSRGEAICYVLLTQFYAGRSPLFRPQFLGDKWPLADFIVELIGVTNTVPFFFVQVRSTRDGYTNRQNRLRVQLPREQVTGLASYPAPTYIIGIDEVMESGYIVSVNGERQTRIASLSTEFPINDTNRLRLYEEVAAYWGTRTYPKLTSAFNDSLWR